MSQITFKRPAKMTVADFLAELEIKDAARAIAEGYCHPGCYSMAVTSLSFLGAIVGVRVERYLGIDAKPMNDDPRDFPSEAEAMAFCVERNQTFLSAQRARH